MKPGVLIITGDTAKYGSGHSMRMHAVALELKKRKIDVQKLCIAADSAVAVPLPFSLVILDRRDTAFNPPLLDLPVRKIAVDNRGAGRDEAGVVADLLPHPEMDKKAYAAALANIILSPEVSSRPSLTAQSRITLHNTPEEAFAAADFVPGKERLSPHEFIRRLSAASAPALYFGQALFEALYLGLHVHLYPVSEYHKKLAVDLFSRQLIDPDLLAALDGKGLGRFTDLVQSTWKRTDGNV